jgi:hypothetical protein
MARIITMSPGDISARNIETYQFSARFFKIFGEPDVRFSTITRGAPKMGKSSLLLQMADEFCRFGKVLYVTSEESPKSKTFQERLKLFNITNPKIRIVFTHDKQALEKLIQTGGYRFVILDSIQKMKLSIDDFIRLKDKYQRRKLSWHLVSQQVGSIISFQHEVDTLIEVRDGMADVNGRFKVSDVLHIFETVGGYNSGKSRVNQSQQILFK